MHGTMSLKLLVTYYQTVLCRIENDRSDKSL